MQDAIFQQARDVPRGPAEAVIAPLFSVEIVLSPVLFFAAGSCGMDCCPKRGGCALGFGRGGNDGQKLTAACHANVSAMPRYSAHGPVLTFALSHLQEASIFGPAT